MRPKTQQQATKEAYELVDLLSEAFGVRWKASVWYNLMWCYHVYYNDLVIHTTYEGRYWAQFIPGYARLSDCFFSDDPIEVIFHLIEHTQNAVQKELDYYKRILIDSCPASDAHSIELNEQK